MRSMRVLAVLAALMTVFGLMGGVTAAVPDGAGGPFDYWTPERIASAQPRDLVLDERGLGYLLATDGSLTPYGHSTSVERRPLAARALTTGAPIQQAKPGGGDSDVVAPLIKNLNPADGSTIGQVHTFSAVVTDDSSGVKSVTFTIAGTRFTPSCDPSGFCSIQISFTGSGSTSWTVTAKDNGDRGGNTATESASFTVSADGGGSDPGGDIVTNDRWTSAGDVQSAAGRILFTMPDGKDYVCSGTAVSDGVIGRSIILTAAHCVYDDVNKGFASNAIFIPSQDDGGTDRTDWNCANDPLGCWAVDHGVVDVNWTTRTFPDNIPWDYGFYVVSDEGAHEGASAPEALDAAVPELTVKFTAPAVGDTSTALGYSYSNDPYFMYCQEPMGTNGSANYWLPSCDLSGGSSGGPWLQPLDAGSGTVISVNSWGYTTRSGMAGPKLHGNSAEGVFFLALDTSLLSADRGFVFDPNAGAAGDGFTTTSTSNGGTWTATVSSEQAFSGFFVDGPECEGVNDCVMSGIMKRDASVTFITSEGVSLEILKP